MHPLDLRVIDIFRCFRSGHHELDIGLPAAGLTTGTIAHTYRLPKKSELLYRAKPLYCWPNI